MFVIFDGYFGFRVCFAVVCCLSCVLVFSGLVPLFCDIAGLFCDLLVGFDLLRLGYFCRLFCVCMLL